MRIVLLLMATTSLYAGYYVYNNYYRKDIKFKNNNELLIKSKIPVRYKIKIADTYASREKGLMFVKEMPANEGMIFIYENVSLRRMWMKNTYIPLDMLFVSEDLKIVHIHEGAKPEDETIISSLVPVKYTIELNAGEVAKKNIKIGDKIEIIRD